MSHLTALVRLGAAALGISAILSACGSEPAEAPPPNVPTVDAAPIPVQVADAQPIDAAPPPPKDAGYDGPASPCLRQLHEKGIPFEETIARGVEEAVRVTGPIAGVSFTKEDTDDLTTDPMACSFVLTLEKFAQVLKAKGVTQVGTLGSYCYRCCCSWSPSNDCRGPTDPEPNCGGNGYSNHSWGRAIDVRYLHLQGGLVYDINDTAEWVEGTSSTTCTTGLTKQVGVSKILYSIVCDAAKQSIFKTILTPNYNDAHRNHWHMDTGQAGSVSGPATVRDLEETLVDVGDYADTCGGH